MADFARWVVAAEPALGWPAGSFMTAYTGNREAIHEIALDAAMIVPPLRQLLDSGEFIGTATELLDRLAGIVGEAATHRKGWPGIPTSLSRELARIAPNLRAVDIEVEKRREAHGHRVIAVRRVPKTPSPASPVPDEWGQGDATVPDGDAAETSDAHGVTRDRAHDHAGDAGDGQMPLPARKGVNLAREALGIFGDEMTSESVARLRSAAAMVQIGDELEYGGLA
jgi:hypothetical protein